ncbi:hypothetical protein [Rhodococcoides fascians]|uniref:hypothetical protein n=1 Tax=Rhodococcoides fascians TaxID=1828 RepID=UPI0006909B10|nr:hypothetical protein [Rhodococcus fascians]
MADDTTVIRIDAMTESMLHLNKMFEARGINHLRFVSMPEFPGDKDVVPVERRKVRWNVTANCPDGRTFAYTGEPVLAQQAQDQHNVAILLSVIEVARMLGFDIDVVADPPT